jgi:GNAT superfamily N-acetyltransferase
MAIRPLDVFDDTDFERFHAVTQRAEAFGRPHHSRTSLDEAKQELRRQDPTERGEAWVACDDGVIVAGMSLWFPQLDNLSKCWGSLGVDPDHRRRGFGSALVRHAVARMTQEGRTTFLMETAYPFERREDHPYRRFAQDNGFTVAIDEILRILSLPVDPTLLQSLVDEAAPHHSAYRIESFEADLPEELLASYCLVRNQLGVDAPSGDVDFEPESMTPALFLEKVAKDKEIGRTMLVTVAIDKTDAIVAYSELALSPAPNKDVWQWGTLVHREHRGHRLGLALKARNLQRLAMMAPTRGRVLTCNAETNHHMVGINESLGFEAVEVVPMLELRLPARPG